MHRIRDAVGPAGALAAAGVLLCAVGPAGAATRYAAATGSNKQAAEPCTKRAPCGLRRAIENGRRIDDVVVATGPYSVSREIAAPAGLDIRAAGRSRPRLAGATDPGTAVLRITDGSKVTGLRLSQSGDDAAAIRASGDAVVENLQLVTSGDRASGADLAFDPVLRGSTIRTTGPQSIGVRVPFSGSGSPIGNSTVIAQGADSVGIRVDAFSSPIPGGGGLRGSASVLNTVVRGTAADLQARGDLQDFGFIRISYSNYVTVQQLGGFVTEGEGNQSTAPLFANPAGNDFHQLAGSPTIDAGTIDPANGRSDPDGDPRLLGAAPDIGADEYVPPASSSPPPPPTADPDADPVDRTRPAIRRLSMTRRRFAPGRRATPRSSSRGRPRRGTAFRLRLSEAARISIRLKRVVRGRRMALAGTLRRAGRQGTNRIRFSGRIGRRALRPGRYRALVKARDAAGNVSRARRVRFRVVRPR